MTAGDAVVRVRVGRGGGTGGKGDRIAESSLKSKRSCDLLAGSAGGAKAAD
jgi:hypothetical protein